MRVLICDGLHRQGVKIFQKAKNVEVEVRDQIEQQELLKLIPKCEGLVVRSRTKIDSMVLKKARRLRVIGRLGTGQVQGGDDEAGIITACHHFGLEDGAKVAGPGTGTVVDFVVGAGALGHTGAGAPGVLDA